MKQDIKKLWLEALRNGEYKKGIGCLKNEDRYCCLGVLCDLHSKTTGKGRFVEEANISVYKYDGGRVEFFLPKPVQDWAGLEENNPMIDESASCRHSLSTLNDDNGKSFEEIADTIEKRL